MTEVKVPPWSLRGPGHLHPWLSPAESQAPYALHITLANQEQAAPEWGFQSYRSSRSLYKCRKGNSYPRSSLSEVLPVTQASSEPGASTVCHLPLHYLLESRLNIWYGALKSLRTYGDVNNIDVRVYQIVGSIFSLWNCPNSGLRLILGSGS